MPLRRRGFTRRSTLKYLGATGAVGLAGCLGDDDDDDDAADDTDDDAAPDDEWRPDDELDGELTIYTATDVSPIARAFEDRAGITVNDTLYRGPEAVGRFVSEAEAGEFDANVLMTAAGFLSHEGVIEHLAEVEPSNYDMVFDDRTQETFEDIGMYNLGVPTSRLIRATPYHEERVDEPPVEHMDFLEDEWEGRISTVPEVDRHYTLLLESGWSEEEAKDYIIDLDAQIPEYAESATGTPDAMLGGQFDVGALIMLEFHARARDDGAPLGLAFPETSAGHLFATGVVEEAENLEAAEAFADFVASDDGQEVVQAEMGWDPAHTELEHGNEHMAAALEEYDTEIIDIVYEDGWAAEVRPMVQGWIGLA